MNAISMQPAQMPLSPLNFWKQVKRIGPLGAIILLHLAFFYALQSGAIKKVATMAPKEVFASLITPERAPEPAPPKEQPKPKTVPVVKKTVAPPLPVPVTNTPSPTAVTAPPAPPQPAVPAAAAVPDPSPAPAAPAPPKTITSGVEYIQKPQIEYPAASKRMGETGKVMLRVLVDEQGRPETMDIQKSSNFPRLDEAAKQAVRRARFKPNIEDGKATRVYVIVPIVFLLDN
ncbi:energy transducer TonB [Oxalobacteraceae bacterium CAVE-383]|nr:energy transducer TonB [Oxalobacteraceae bacterium CAVE-383]